MIYPKYDVDALSFETFWMVTDMDKDLAKELEDQLPDGVENPFSPENIQLAMDYLLTKLPLSDGHYLHHLRFSLLDVRSILIRKVLKVKGQTLINGDKSVFSGPPVLKGLFSSEITSKVDFDLHTKVPFFFSVFLREFKRAKISPNIDNEDLEQLIAIANLIHSSSINTVKHSHLYQDHLCVVLGVLERAKRERSSFQEVLK